MFSEKCNGDCANCDKQENFFKSMDNFFSFLTHLEEEETTNKGASNDSNTTQSLDDVIDSGVMKISVDEIQQYIKIINSYSPDEMINALNAVGSYMSTVTKDDLLNAEKVRLQLDGLLNKASTPVVVRNLREALNNISKDLLMAEKTTEFFYGMRDRAVMLKDMPCPKKYRDTVSLIAGNMKSLAGENKTKAFNSMASIIATIQNIRW